ncbi:MAG: methyltransferase [Desulfamplus sp.]|nr:methyltransferase [Desulfamplus sp.]
MQPSTTESNYSESHYNLDPHRDLYGDLYIDQPSKGYRFSMDSFLVAEYAAGQTDNLIKRNNPWKILDIGTGCAPIALALCLRLRPGDIKITAVEIQEELARTACRNIVMNRMEKEISIIQGDIRMMTCRDLEGPFDLVVSNPPYHKKEDGRISLDQGRAIARHEVTLNLGELMQSAAKMMKNRAILTLIYPVTRLTELVCAMHHYRIEPSEMRFVHTKSDSPPSLILISGIKNGSSPLIVSPPVNMDKMYMDKMNMDKTYKRKD